MKLQAIKKKQCPNCSEYNNTRAEYCKYCSHRFFDDNVFFKKLKSSCFTASIFGVVGFEVFYILAFWLAVNSSHSNSFIFVSIIIPLMGIVTSFFAKKFKISSGLLLLFIGVMYVLLEIFLISSIGVMFKYKDDLATFILMLVGVTLPNFICGAMFIFNSYKLLTRTIKEKKEREEKSDYRVPVLITIIASCLSATGIFILILNYMFI